MISPTIKASENIDTLLFQYRQLIVWAPINMNLPMSLNTSIQSVWPNFDSKKAKKMFNDAELIELTDIFK